jgi:hypothetical protein
MGDAVDPRSGQANDSFVSSCETLFFVALDYMNEMTRRQDGETARTSGVAVNTSSVGRTVCSITLGLRFP